MKIMKMLNSMGVLCKMRKKLLTDGCKSSQYGGNASKRLRQEIEKSGREVYKPKKVRKGGSEMAEGGNKPIQIIKTDKAGPPVGPYSQGIKAGGFVFVAGEKGMDPVTKQMVSGGIEAETRRTLENIKAILEEAGSSMDLVVSTFVFMTDLTEFSKMNEIYAEYFNVNPPGRTTVEVQSLPAGAHVEITATALAGT